jgi:hypothetical protein
VALNSQKKVLLIDSRPGGDFSLDLIWAGLVRRFGIDGVVDFPRALKHHVGRPTLVGDHEKDYGAERSSLGYTDLNESVPSYTEGEVGVLIANGLISRIFLDERFESIELYHRLGARFYDIPVTVVAGHDRFWNKDPETVRYMIGSKFERMFIDDWQPDYDHLPYASLINLSINYDHLWDASARENLLANKVYDLCFMGYNSSGSRTRVIDHTAKKWRHLNNHIVLEKLNDKFDSFVRHQEYFSKMAQSKICINVPGASMSGRALRYYEIPYVGSFMASQVFPAKQLHPFEHRKHCVFFENIAQLDEWIDYLLNDAEGQKVREQMARDGHEHAVKYHTIDARMDYIFSTLEKS